MATARSMRPLFLSPALSPPSPPALTASAPHIKDVTPAPMEWPTTEKESQLRESTACTA
eukprot:CAMPEP_0113936094 /NCGR_PEP_ID=MMETSP1339-20121228/3075_1 /TAXON_ID=94617 /ORGANISM="Fibrocapsa japonica" /LENGTH=58 /DNA_ID=CAMNT_0000938435 /DNA_START=650 /DNA_END=826 /DNA_ORIENTATION=+ /assembly_acc=CAM_ASM_000762